MVESQPAQPIWLVRFEVAPVDVEDASATRTRGRVRYVHRQVPILPHELTHARTVCRAKFHKAEPISIDHLPQRPLGIGRGPAVNVPGFVGSLVRAGLG